MEDKMTDFLGKNGRGTSRGDKSPGSLLFNVFASQIFPTPRGFLPNLKLGDSWKFPLEIPENPPWRFPGNSSECFDRNLKLIFWKLFYQTLRKLRDDSNVCVILFNLYEKCICLSYEERYWLKFLNKYLFVCLSRILCQKYILFSLSNILLVCNVNCFSEQLNEITLKAIKFSLHYSLLPFPTCPLYSGDRKNKNFALNWCCFNANTFGDTIDIIWISYSVLYSVLSISGIKLTFYKRIV